MSTRRSSVLSPRHVLLHILYVCVHVLACLIGCVALSALTVFLVSSRSSLVADEDTQTIYDELPFDDEIFNLSRRNLELYDKLGKAPTIRQGGEPASGSKQKCWIWPR